MHSSTSHPENRIDPLRDLQPLSLDDLRELSASLLVETSELRTLIKKTELLASQSGVPVNSTWHIKANHARRTRTVLRERVCTEILQREKAANVAKMAEQQEIAQQKRAERDAFNSRLTQAFVDAARAALEPGLFHALIAKANDAARAGDSVPA